MRNSGGKTLIKEKVIKFFWTQGYVKKKVIRGLFRFNISVHLNSNYTLDLICAMMISLRVITSVNGGKNAFPYFGNFISSKWLFFSTYRMGLAISLVATVKEKVSYFLQQLQTWKLSTGNSQKMEKPTANFIFPILTIKEFS